ncbi:unnamed protein product [Gadus morhua 'NCC']
MEVPAVHALPAPRYSCPRFNLHTRTLEGNPSVGRPRRWRLVTGRPPSGGPVLHPTLTASQQVAAGHVAHQGRVRDGPENSQPRSYVAVNLALCLGQRLV